MTHTPKHEATDAMGMESQRDEAVTLEDALEAIGIIEAFPSNAGEVEGRITEKGARMIDSCCRDIRQYLATTQPAEQSASSPVEGLVIAAARELLDACYTADANSDLSDFIDGSLLTRLDKALTTRSALNQARKPEGAEPVGCAEVEVGRAVYGRIEALMVRKPVPQSSDAAELDYLSHLAESVEEVGGYDGPLRPLARTPMDREAVAAFLKERDQSVEAYEASDEERLESAEAILGLVSAHPAHEAGEVERLRRALEGLTGSFSIYTVEEDTRVFFKVGDSIQTAEQDSPVGIAWMKIEAEAQEARAALEDKAQGAQQ